MAFSGQKNLYGAARPPELIPFAFVTTGATVTLYTSLKVIQAHAFGLMGTPGTGEVLSIDGTRNDDGTYTVSNGAITVRRAATTTSGLQACAILYGY